METLALVSFSLAVTLMILAMVYQWRDSTPGRGGTMGGEMTAGLIWGVAALLCGLGALAYLPWYGAVLVALLTLGGSFLVRMLISRVR